MLSDTAKSILDTLPATLAAQTALPGEGHIRPGFRARTLRLLSLVRCAMYPKIFGSDTAMPTTRELLSEAAERLSELLGEVLPSLSGEQREQICMHFLQALPHVAMILRTDVRAAYDGDPAARSEEEIMLTYPAFEAISIFRIAHVLFELHVPLLPRVMTEYAHRLTGVDIHPGAKIGPYFFIDHATGVVVGETCTIGEHVKLYQGVTLGAKSFETDENGNPVKGIKRHPDIGNHVVIYANATILGGNTVIGDHCVIGGNVWLTHSVPPGQKIYYTGGQ